MSSVEISKRVCRGALEEPQEPKMRGAAFFTTYSLPPALLIGRT